MAVAVPLLLGAAGVGATAAAITAVAFQVTGINDKINNAAAQVFGDDLVKVANIAGMAYGAYESFSGFGDSALTGATEAAADASSAVDYVNEMDKMSDAAAAAKSVSDTSGIENVAKVADTVAPKAASTTASELANNESFNLSELQKSASDPIEQALANKPITEATEAAKASTVDTQAPAQATAQNTNATNANAAGANASGANAAGNGATAANAAAERNFNLNQLKQGTNYGDYTPSTNTLPAGASWIDKAKGLFIDKNGNISNAALMVGGNLLSGAMSGYSAAKAREQAQANLDQQLQRQARLANMGLAGWVQKQ